MRKLIWLMLFTSACRLAAEKNDAVTPNVASESRFEKEINYCKVVAHAGSQDVDVYNAVSPVSIAYSLSSSLDENEMARIAKQVEFKILQAPAHGVLIQSQISTKRFSYHANENYSGMDKIIFEIKLDDKIYKGIYFVYVTPGHPAAIDGCTEQGPYNTPEGDGESSLKKKQP